MLRKPNSQFGVNLDANGGLRIQQEIEQKPQFPESATESFSMLYHHMGFSGPWTVELHSQLISKQKILSLKLRN